MVAQLAERPSRIERGPAENPMNRIGGATKAVKNITKKPVTLNFVCMCAVAGVLDIIGLFTSEVPGVGIAISIISATIFIPWFYFSGVKFNMKKIGTFGTTSILEMIPIVGNAPFIILNVIYSYYSE
jgi:hypothetical protein